MDFKCVRAGVMIMAENEIAIIRCLRQVINKRRRPTSQVLEANNDK